VSARSRVPPVPPSTNLADCCGGSMFHSRQIAMTMAAPCLGSKPSPPAPRVPRPPQSARQSGRRRAETGAAKNIRIKTSSYLPALWPKTKRRTAYRKNGKKMCAGGGTKGTLSALVAFFAWVFVPVGLSWGAATESEIGRHPRNFYLRPNESATSMGRGGASPVPRPGSAATPQYDSHQNPAGSAMPSKSNLFRLICRLERSHAAEQ
jgi:hypothetical protein